MFIIAVNKFPLVFMYSHRILAARHALMQSTFGITGVLVVSNAIDIYESRSMVLTTLRQRQSLLKEE